MHPPYVKDGINDYVVAGRQEAVNPNQTGTKAAAHYQFQRWPGETAVIRLRLNDVASDRSFGRRFAELIEPRRREADEFYPAITPSTCRRRCGQCDAAGAGRHAVEQAVLSSSMSISGSTNMAPIRCVFDTAVGTASGSI